MFEFRCNWISFFNLITLLWRHNEHDGVSNHQPHDCLLNRLFRRRSKKIAKPRVTGDRWFPRTNGQWSGKCLHLMTSSWEKINRNRKRRTVHVFIRLFEKRTYYAVAMSVRLSVRPPVRVFRTFLQHAFVKILFSKFWRLFLRILDFSKFSGLFLHLLRYQFETWYIHAVGGITRQVRVSFQSGHFDILYSQK